MMMAGLQLGSGSSQVLKLILQQKVGENIAKLKLL